MITSTAQKYRPLLIATTAVIALPFALAAMGLSHNTGTTIVALAVAAMGLNLCIGYTGLVSFGHGAWFGIGAYAAGLIQLNWFPGQIWLPLLLSTIVVAAASAFVGAVILRRRGVYFSLLTLALAADLHHRLSLDDTHRRRGRPRRAQARQLRWLQPR
jgi:branched-chain amino acid transport system ATP-binding protein